MSVASATTGPSRLATETWEPDQGRPLRKHVLFESHDRDEALERVARVFCPHELHVLRRGGSLAARQHHASLGRVSLNYLTYGEAVAIQPQPFESFYLVQVPLAGSARIRVGKHEFASSLETASAVNPSDSLRMEWSAQCAQLIVRFERSFVEAFLANHLGRTLKHPLSFDPQVDCRPERAGRWLRLIQLIVQELDATSALGPLASRSLEQTMLALLLESQPHNYAEQLARGSAGCAPGHVRRATEFIEAHVSEPIDVEDIVMASGVSMRSLYDGFRRFRGTSPMQFLRTLRLRRVREDLSAADGTITVSEVAARWGFYQFGRFAAQYRQLFGETPSATLRRASAWRDLES